MDYAKNILQKYGWKEGQGLGKNEEGISKPVKCGLKFDKAGIGYNEKISKEENNQWWIQIFNRAAANISTDSENRRNKVHEKKSKSGRDGELVGKSSLTDEELFQVCGGRTAHKAARHGFRLSGKLKRVHQQEKMMEEELNVSNERVEIRKEKKSKFSSLERDKGQRSNQIKKNRSKRIEGSDAVTVVADSSFPVRAAEDCDRASCIIDDTSKYAINEEDQSNCNTKKKKPKNVKEFVTGSVPIDSTFPVEIGQNSDRRRRPKKEKLKAARGTRKVMENETHYVRATSESDTSSRQFKRNKR